MNKRDKKGGRAAALVKTELRTKRELAIRGIKAPSNYNGASPFARPLKHGVPTYTREFDEEDEQLLRATFGLQVALEQSL